MADTAVSAFASLTAAGIATGDKFPVIDVSASGAAKNKSITKGEMDLIYDAIGAATAAQSAAATDATTKANAAQAAAIAAAATDATTKANAAQTATTIALATAAWVTGAGNDGTGAVGNPAKPYLTMQAAFDAGATTLFVGNGTFAGITKAGAISVNILGLGRSKTTITLIDSTNSGAITVRDLGLHSFTLTTVSRDGAIGGEGSGGTASSDITLENVVVGTVQNTGGTGGPSASGGANNAGVGGLSGTLTCVGRCEIATVNHNGGVGGTGTDSGDNGGNGGNGGNVFVNENSVIATLNSKGGDGGAGLGAGTGGTGGIGSAASIRMSRISTLLDVQGGAGGSGGTPGSQGAPGSLDGNHCELDQITMTQGAGAVEGTISGTFIRSGTITAGTPTISALLSRINGTTY